MDPVSDMLALQVFREGMGGFVVIKKMVGLIRILMMVRRMIMMFLLLLVTVVMMVVGDGGDGCW